MIPVTLVTTAALPLACLLHLTCIHSMWACLLHLKTGITDACKKAQCKTAAKFMVFYMAFFKTI